jgi:hypothetical protein
MKVPLAQRTHLELADLDEAARHRQAVAELVGRRGRSTPRPPTPLVRHRRCRAKLAPACPRWRVGPWPVVIPDRGRNQPALRRLRQADHGAEAGQRGAGAVRPHGPAVWRGCWASAVGHRVAGRRDPCPGTGRREECPPLPAEVGEALAGWLRRVPALRAPAGHHPGAGSSRPLSSSAIRPA